MATQRLYLFNDLLEDSDAGFEQSQIWKLPRTRVSWIAGTRHVKQFALPIEVELNPDYGSELLDAYHESIPIWSDRLIAVLHEARVDNFDTYEVVIRDPRSGLVASHYKAVNVLTRIAASDSARSEWDGRSEMGAREFKRLVLDANKADGARMFRLAERPTMLIVDEETRCALEGAALRGVRIDALEMTPD
jgi:hypothetical protein